MIGYMSLSTQQKKSTPYIPIVDPKQIGFKSNINLTLPIIYVSTNHIMIF